MRCRYWIRSRSFRDHASEPNRLRRVRLKWTNLLAFRLCGRCREGLFQVVDDVIGVFDPDRHANVLGADTGTTLLVGVELLVRGAGRVDDECFGIADVGQVRAEFAGVDELFARFHSALDAEAENRTFAVGQVLGRVGLVGVVGQSGVVHPFHGVVRFQELGNLESVFAVAWHPQVERFDSHQEQECGERAHRGPGVAEPVGADVDVVGDVAHSTQVLFENGTMIGRRRGAELRPFLRLIRPLEVTAVDDRTADVHTVAAQELRRAVDHDVDTVVDRTQQHWGHHGIVAEDRQRTVWRRVGGVGDGFEIRHIVARVSDALHVDQASVLVDESVDVFGFVRIEEANFDAEVFQGLGEQGPRSTIQRCAADDVLSAVRDRQDGCRDGGLTRCKAQARDATVHRCESFFQNVHGRVHQPAVDVPEFR